MIIILAPRQRKYKFLEELSSSGPGQVTGQVQKVQGLRTKDLDLGYTLNLVCHPPLTTH